MRKLISPLIALFLLASCGKKAGDSDSAATTTPNGPTTLAPLGGTHSGPAAGSIPFDDGLRVETSTFGVAAGKVVADNSVIKLADGSYRMYVFADSQGVVSAKSTDGLNFTAESGSRLPDGNGMPRAVVLPDGRVLLYVINGGGINGWISSDGLKFTAQKNIRIDAPAGLGDITGLSTPVKGPDGKWHAYFSDLPRPGEPIKGHQVHSATSPDLFTWTVEEGIRLGAGKLVASAEHPDAVVDKDGTIRLYFFQNQPKGLFMATSTDGVTFSDAQSANIDCNDPSFLDLDATNYRLYCGDFSPEKGGVIKSALIAKK